VEVDGATPGSVEGRLARVRKRIAAACGRVGRDPAGVRLVAVTKRIPLADVVAACTAGQWDLGENRIQDALARIQELPPRLAAAGLDPARVRWHFIGHLQTNKAGKAIGPFQLLHALDSQHLAERLEDRAAAAGRIQPVLLEVNVSREPQKHGCDPEVAVELARDVAPRAHLDLQGLMTMARYEAPAAELRETFAGLRRLVERARDATGLPLPELSMGMSDDFEIAVEEGATLVRVGTAIFGPRPRGTD
jgi:pyridoxal phosphate enzyme (YggS family)